jgi:hypothetical protein
VDLLGFEVAMDMGWVMTVASPTNPSAQVTIVGNDDMAAPGISVEVADVDAVHAKAVEQGLEIAYPLRDYPVTITGPSSPVLLNSVVIALRRRR